MKLHNRKWRRTRACVWLSARVFFKAMPHPSFKKQLTYGDQLTCDTLSNRFVLTQMSKWLTSKNISVFHLNWDKCWYTCCKTTFLVFQRRMQWFACSLSKSNWTPEINSHGWAAHPALDVLLTAELRHYCPSRSSKPSHRMTSSKSEVTMVRPEWARGKREEWRRDEERGWERWERKGWGDGLGNGGQPLLSASIREPRGDMGAGKRGRINGGGGGVEVGAGSRPSTSHPSALGAALFVLPLPSVHSADVQPSSCWIYQDILHRAMIVVLFRIQMYLTGNNSDTLLMLTGNISFIVGRVENQNKWKIKQPIQTILWETCNSWADCLISIKTRLIFNTICAKHSSNHCFQIVLRSRDLFPLQVIFAPPSLLLKISPLFKDFFSLPWYQLSHASVSEISIFVLTAH